MEAGCRCRSLQDEAASRADRFRELCALYFHAQDDGAKRVLAWFETCKLDQITILAPGETDESDAALQAEIEALGLIKCAQPGHGVYFSETLQQLEIVKSQVRSAYHASVAQQQYSEFEIRASRSQGSHYELRADGSGHERLTVRVQDDYVGTAEQHTAVTHQLKEFVHAHVKNIGCHPFLAGLRAVLQWNLESSTVVAWTLSDAVFVESGGPEFADAALSLLVDALNFSHCLASDSSASNGQTAALVRSREWHLDPYLSDHDLRAFLALLPMPKRLEGRPTGAKRATDTSRLNIHGLLDEHHNFFQRWCVLL